MTTVAYLEVHFRAHGLAVGDDGLVVGVLAVPAIKLNAAASGEQNLGKDCYFNLRRQNSR